MIVTLTTYPDNAHISQTRLILLDAQLVFFTALSLYSYIRFRKLRYWCVIQFFRHAHYLPASPNREFTFDWWFWLIATGVSLAATLGSKMVGLFTFLTIGTAVLVDLWDILDFKKGHSMVRTENMCYKHSHDFLTGILWKTFCC